MDNIDGWLKPELQSHQLDDIETYTTEQHTKSIKNYNQ